MTDPHVAPDDETPLQRRHRLMNLTNPAFEPLPADEDGPSAPATPPPATPADAVAPPPSTGKGRQKDG